MDVNHKAHKSKHKTPDKTRRSAKIASVANYKRVVVNCANRVGVQMASRRYAVPKKTIQGWRQQRLTNKIIIDDNIVVATTMDSDGDDQVNVERNKKKSNQIIVKKKIVKIAKTRVQQGQKQQQSQKIADSCSKRSNELPLFYPTHSDESAAAAQTHTVATSNQRPGKSFVLGLGKTVNASPNDFTPLKQLTPVVLKRIVIPKNKQMGNSEPVKRIVIPPPLQDIAPLNKNMDSPSPNTSALANALKSPTPTPVRLSKRISMQKAQQQMKQLEQEALHKLQEQQQIVLQQMQFEQQQQKQIELRKKFKLDLEQQQQKQIEMRKLQIQEQQQQQQQQPTLGQAYPHLPHLKTIKGQTIPIMSKLSYLNQIPSVSSDHPAQITLVNTPGTKMLGAQTQQPTEHFQKLEAPQLRTEMDSNEEMCLRWNSHHVNMQTSFPAFLQREQYVDCTLCSEGQAIRCHKLVLSSCSPYFEEIISNMTPWQHPVIVLRGVPFWVLKSLIDFMYIGEVNIEQSKLQGILDAAEELKIKGLTSKAPPPHQQQFARKTSFVAPIYTSTSNLTTSTFTNALNVLPSPPLGQLQNKPTLVMQGQAPGGLLITPSPTLAGPSSSLGAATQTGSTRISTSQATPPTQPVTTRRTVKRRPIDSFDNLPFVKKGTKSRPTLKTPKFYHSEYEDKPKPSSKAHREVHLKPPKTQSVADTSFDSATNSTAADFDNFNILNIKSEPIDIGETDVYYEDEFISEPKILRFGVSNNEENVHPLLDEQEQDQDEIGGSSQTTLQGEDPLELEGNELGQLQQQQVEEQEGEEMTEGEEKVDNDNRDNRSGQLEKRNAIEEGSGEETAIFYKVGSDESKEVPGMQKTFKIVLKKQFHKQIKHKENEDLSFEQGTEEIDNSLKDK